MLAFRQRGLWRHADFLKLWGGQTVSLFGSEITYLAIPLTALQTLNANPIQMGLLRTAGLVPLLLFGLFAGVWVDRWPRRPVLILADVGRAVVLALIPAALLCGALRLELLYAVSFLTGCLTLLFDVAYQSYLPCLVGREYLVESNSKLEVSRTAAQVAGPGLTGLILQVVSAPVAVVLDALSFLVSATLVGFIAGPEPDRGGARARRPIWAEIGEGIRFVSGHRLLRALIGCSTTWNLFNSIMLAVLVMYMVRDLGLTPGVMGVVLGAAEIGSLAGAVLAGPAARRFGLGRVLLLSTVVGALGAWLIPLARGAGIAAICLLLAGSAVKLLGSLVYSINQVSLRQAITPDPLQGRVSATVRLVTWCTIPVGSILGGVLGEMIGLRIALAAGAGGLTLASLWLLFSPVPSLRERPAAAG